jgi:hypothetical protein
MLPKQGRKRNRQDWITTEEVQFQPIIDSALFEKVQKKFVDRSESPQKNRTPRVESFWLRGFLVCFKCGKPMRAWNEKSWRSYFCSEYGTYGRLNPTGCRCHRVKADLIEGIVKSYLEETGQKAGVLQASQNKSVIISKAVEEYKTANELSNAAYDSLKLAAASFLQEGDQSVEIYGNCLPVRREGSQIFLPEGWSVEDIYDAFSAKQEVKLKSLIAKKEAEFDDLFQQFAKLKVQTAIDRANKLMAEKEQEILGLKSKLKPLSEVNRKAWQEVSSKIKALSEAKLAMQGANYRRLSESLKSLVDKIVCHFRYSESKKANQPKSYLEKVEIFPVVGQALVRYPEGNKPGQG